MELHQADPVTTALFLGAIAAVVLLVVLLFVFREQLLASARVVGGAAGGNAGTFLQDHKWFLLSLVLIPIGFWLLVSGSLRHLILLVALASAVFALTQFWKSAPQSWTVGAALSAVLLFLWWSPNWGLLEGGVEKYQSWVTGDAADRSDTTTACGPSYFVDGTATVAQPLTLERDLACTHTIQKSMGVPVQVRFNDEPWQNWLIDGEMPRAASLTRTITVRPLRADEQVYVLVNFPARR